MTIYLGDRVVHPASVGDRRIAKVTFGSTQVWPAVVTPPAGNLWTPADITPAPVAWFDASDASTITLVPATANKVSNWRSKVAPILGLAQSGTALQMTYESTGANGAGLIGAGGIESWMATSLDYTSPFLTSVVFMVPGADVRPMEGMGFGHSNGPARRGLWFDPDNEVTWEEDSRARGQNTSTNVVDRRCLASRWNDANNEGIRIRVNGTDGTGVVTLNGSLAATGQTRIVVNVLAQPLTHIYGHTSTTFAFHSVLVFSQRLSDSDVEKIEGWGMHRMGEAALLPANHPYKNAPPTKPAP